MQDRPRERLQFDPNLRLARDVEKDLAQLRRLMLERHDVHLPIDDPLCTEFTAFSAVVAQMLGGMREEREALVDELNTLLHGTSLRVEEAISGAAQPLARAMKDTFEPKTVAREITGEVYEDLRRECRAVVREARWAFAFALSIALAASFVVLYVAGRRLAEAEMLIQQSPVCEPSEPPPMPDAVAP